MKVFDKDRIQIATSLSDADVMVHLTEAGAYYLLQDIWMALCHSELGAN
jgi:hypothetical protein